MSFCKLGPALLFLGCACHISAQSIEPVESGGSWIHLRVWAAASPPVATVLLVPGWAGGPDDVFGIGKALSSKRIAVVVLTPRGWHGSDGTATFAHGLEDIGAALRWIRASDRPGVNSSEIVLGGHSWGGGMSLAYAAADGSVRRVFSIAGTDHAQLIRQYQSDSSFAAMLDRALASSAAPEGPIRFSVPDVLRELAENQAVYGMIENADRLADRKIALFGGWEDVNVTVDRTLLPFYRALKGAGARDVQFKVYHTNHGFGNVRDQLRADLLAWIQS